MKTLLKLGKLAAWCFVCLAAAFALSSSGRLSHGSNAQAARVSSSGYTSSAVCGQCHTAIYNNWRNSLHALAIKDPIFQAAYTQVLMNEGPQAKKLCLRCHAPTTFVTQDFDLSQQISKEGVTCDFCHTLVKVNVGNRTKPFEPAPGRIKRGPFVNAKSPAHETKKSSLYRSADLCGACHQFVAENGVPIMDTFEEWRASSYAKRGIICQHCHMQSVSVSDVKVGLGGSAHSARLHDVPGGHSVDQLRKAVKVKIKDIKQSGSKVTVILSVTNFGSGHYVPTGLPSRKLVVRFKALNPEKKAVYEGNEVLQKVMADSNGKVLTDDAALMMHSFRIVRDNRLRPGETRDLTFRFTKPLWTRITVEAKVIYVYEPKVLKTESVSVEMASDKKDIK